MNIDHVKANIKMAPIQNQIISINNTVRNIIKDENREYIRSYIQ